MALVLARRFGSPPRVATTSLHGSVPRRISCRTNKQDDRPDEGDEDRAREARQAATQTPSALKIHPPTNAPTIPMMMSPIRPYPVPPITSEASTPAISPTMIQVRNVMASPEPVR